MKINSDYPIHVPCGSNVPGKVDANPYMSVHPKELRRLVELEQDPEVRSKMISALKQFEREYTYPGYPWRPPRAEAKRVCSNFLKLSELVNPAINLPYYQDGETDQGTDEIIESLQGLYDNYDAEKFDVARQGIRPIVDIDTSEGDFLNPKESPIGGPVTKGDGDGPDPEGLEYSDPPTGGETGGI
jgi:hypothetical protein